MSIETLPKLFPELNGHRVDDCQLEILGRKMAAGNTPSGGPPAGYTYFGQFIAHDLTQLSTDELKPQGHGSEPLQERNPALDLDPVYGGAEPRSLIAIEPDGRMRVDLTYSDTGDGVRSDLPRDARGRPIIPDDRNEDNLFIAQMHVLFLRLHNYLLDAYGDGIKNGSERFQFGKIHTRRIYHQLILKDFLARLLDTRVYEQMVVQGKYQTWNQLRVPKEFAGAAFRFGHPMVRMQYRARTDKTRTLRQILTMTGRYQFGGSNLPSLPESERIDWRSMFFESRPPYQVPAGLQENSARGLSPFLDMSIIPTGEFKEENMAIRNLLRGKALELPSGQDIVRAVIEKFDDSEEQLGIRLLSPEELNRRGILDGTDLGQQTPLWYYLLAESEVIGEKARLGPLGSYLVAEVILGLLKNSPQYGRPFFKPPSGKSWSMNELVYDVLNIPEETMQ